MHLYIHSSRLFNTGIKHASILSMKMRACKFGRVRRLFWDYRPQMLRKWLIQIWSFSLEASGQKPYSGTQTSWFYCNYCGEKNQEEKGPIGPHQA